jgi:hypothetical protein
VENAPGSERRVDDPAAGADLLGRVGRLDPPAIQQQQEDEGREVFGAHRWPLRGRCPSEAAALAHC